MRDQPLVDRQRIFEESRDGPFEIGVRYVGDFGVSLVHLLDYVGSQINLPSDHIALLRDGVVKSFGAHIDFVLALLEADGNVDEVAAIDRPLPFKLHVDDFVMDVWILLLMEEFDFFEHWVQFAQGLLFFKELDYCFDAEFADVYSFGCNSAVDLHLVEQAGIFTVFDPLLGVLELFEPFHDFLSFGFELLV